MAKSVFAASISNKVKLNYFSFNNNVEPRARVVFLHVSVVKPYRSVLLKSLCSLSGLDIYNA